MNTNSSNTKQPVGSRWDIEFTRMSYAVRYQLMRCTEKLTVLLSTASLQVKPSFKLHEAGLRATLLITGNHGNLASFEFHLVNGMTEAGVAGAALDINLLAADGEVVAFCTSVRSGVVNGLNAQTEAVLRAAGSGLDPFKLYAYLVKFFDLVLERPRAAWL